MGSPMKPESLALLRMLRDCEWHSYEEIVQKLTALVAPGRAIRMWYVSRKHDRVGPEPSEDEKIAGGARSMAITTIHTLLKRYLEVELDDEGQRVRIRRKPETLPVSPEPEPAEQPAESPAEPLSTQDRPEMPTEAEIRRIVRQETKVILDDFQGRLQAFLLDRFADLEVLTVRGGNGRPASSGWSTPPTGKKTPERRR